MTCNRGEGFCSLFDLLVTCAVPSSMNQKSWILWRSSHHKKYAECIISVSIKKREESNHYQRKMTHILTSLCLTFSLGYECAVKLDSQLWDHDSFIHIGVKIVQAQDKASKLDHLINIQPRLRILKKSKRAGNSCVNSFRLFSEKFCRFLSSARPSATLRMSNVY